MQQYLNLLDQVYKNGLYRKPSRKGMPSTKSYFGLQTEYSCERGFPILTTKKVSFKNIVVELLWFLNKEFVNKHRMPNIKYMVDRGVNIWNDDAFNYYLKHYGKSTLKDKAKFHFMKEDFIQRIKDGNVECKLTSEYSKLGDVGKQYPWLWRNYGGEIDGNNGEDQILTLIHSLKKEPFSRRHILSAWNPNTLDEMALPACHSFVQFYVREEKDFYYLDCILTQRSGDMFLGVPYNISSYSLLMEILCVAVSVEVDKPYKAGRFIHSIGDAHIYENHFSQVEEQLSREPNKHLPKLIITEEGKEYIRQCKFESLEYTMFSLEGYKPQSSIKGELSVGII